MICAATLSRSSRFDRDRVQTVVAMLARLPWWLAKVLAQELHTTAHHLTVTHHHPYSVMLGIMKRIEIAHELCELGIVELAGETHLAPRTLDDLQLFECTDEYIHSSFQP